MLRFRHIFVAAHGRSGSTLLNGVLASIPGVHMRGENNNALFQLHKAICAIKHAQSIQVEPPKDITYPWYGVDAIDVTALSRDLLKAFVDHIIRPPSSTTAWGFKEVRFGDPTMSDGEYDSFLEFLLTQFSEACVIFNVRDMNAMLQSGWWKTDENARNYLESADKRFRGSLERYPNSTFLTSYDQYSQDRDQLCALFDFLGAPFDRAKIDEVFGRRYSY